MLQTHAALTPLPCGAWLDAGHARQVAPLVEATTVEYVSAKQDVHRAEPEVILYLPATHATQSPLLPVYPALHWQSDSKTLPVKSV
jgi:hypothetical protein